MPNLIEQKISLVSHSLSFSPLNLEKKKKNKEERSYVTTWPFCMTHHHCPHMEGFIFVSVTLLVSWCLFLRKEFLTVLRFCLSSNTWSRFLYARLWNSSLRAASDLCWVNCFSWETRLILLHETPSKCISVGYRIWMSTDSPAVSYRTLHDMEFVHQMYS